jgi:cholesterol transport system auxiliary component
MIKRQYKISFLSLLVGTVLISGCASRTSVPDDHFYQLPGILPVKIFDDYLINGTVAMAPLHSDGLHGERAILYIDSNLPLELHRYHYHHWTESPPRLVQESLLKYLRESRLAPNVVRYDPGGQVDGVIKGTLLHFERITGQEGIKVEVALELEYSNQKLHQSWHKEYNVTLPVKNSSLHSTVEGFGSALQQIFNAFTQDLMSDLT